MLELVALLLPIAAGSGWLAAARHFRGRQHFGAVEHLNRTYLRSIDLLLAEKPEKAIDAFVDILEEDCDTVETHVALGNLFRMKGETERAIHIHRGLMNTLAQNDAHRGRVLFELGLDYQHAGLFDRAEKIFVELSGNPEHRENALQQLLQLYQHEKEWMKAIECARTLQNLGKIKRGESVAQFYCELADEALCAGDDNRAEVFVRNALSEDACCVRASLQKAQIERSRGDFRRALETLKYIERQNSDYLIEMIDPLMECYDHLGDVNEQIAYFRRLYGKFRLDRIMLILADLIKQSSGIGQAVVFLSDALDQRPSISGMSHLIALQMIDRGGDWRATLAGLHRLSSRLSSDRMWYHCKHCGFRGEALHWKCPGCHHWESMKPGVDLAVH